ncbi:MAG: hypothetical protein ACE5EN_03900 [Nitrospinota bacterium]
MNELSPMRLLITKLTPAAVFLTIMAGLIIVFASFMYRAQDDNSSDCVVNGKKLDNCVDIIYSKIKITDSSYPAARVAPDSVSIATRYKFVEADGDDWLDTFLGKNEASLKLQEIFKSDPIVDYKAFYRLNLKFKVEGIVGVALFREGFIVFGMYGDDAGSYLVPISPSTVDKVKALKTGDSLRQAADV